MGLGIVLILITSGGLLFEYYLGIGRRCAETP